MVFLTPGELCSESSANDNVVETSDFQQSLDPPEELWFWSCN